MKFVTILAMLCAAIVLSAAETALWDGSKNIFKAASTVTTSIDNGVVTFTGMSAQPGGKYSYIWPKMNIAPTVFKGKKLSITIEPATSKPGDTIYLKGSAAGKEQHVFSYIARQVPAKKATYVLTIGEDSGIFKWIPAQIKADADTPVISLELIMGRNADGSEMKVSFSDIKLVD